MRPLPCLCLWALGLEPRASALLFEEFGEDRFRSEEHCLVSVEPSTARSDEVLQLLHSDFSHLDFEFEGSGFVREEWLA